MTGNPRLKIKIQLHCAEEIAMGPGKADLLEAIRAEGSISAAARAMDMSYRRAWLLVDAMNRCWTEPLVHTAPGRSRTSGAHLTQMGERVLALYRSLQQRLSAAAAGPELKAFEAAILPAPRENQRN
ncbi:MAG TPA: ModE family transcriptional regulator [Novosphingobium sp.]|nr:ModE family transcriptional regulator [Novosphingobium sp.]